MVVPTEALAGDDRETLAFGNHGVGREIGLGGLSLAVYVEQQRQRRGGLRCASRDVDEVGALERCGASRSWREQRERGASGSHATPRATESDQKPRLSRGLLIAAHALRMRRAGPCDHGRGTVRHMLVQETRQNTVYYEKLLLTESV